MLAQHLGNYVIERCIGDGGMGSVYMGVHCATANRVAIKILHQELARDKEMVERFLREGIAAGCIEHPGIVKILDTGLTPKGLPYLVMEYLDGQPLSAYLSERVRLPLEEVLRIGQEIAAALWAAHAKQVIHRDLKPENIIRLSACNVPGQPRIKILDFGIALVAARPEKKRITRDGSFLGTPGYMAPEVVLDPRAASDRSDVYALGVILYQMLVGSPPFTADCPSAVLFKQVSENPPELSLHAPAAPLALCNLVQRLLAKQPEQRPTMLGAFEELLHIERALAQPASAGKRPRRERTFMRSIVWILPSVFVCAVAAAVIHAPSRRPKPEAIPATAAAASAVSPPTAPADESALHKASVVETPIPLPKEPAPPRPVAAAFPRLRLASDAPIAGPARPKPVPIEADTKRPPRVAPASEGAAASLEAAKQAFYDGHYEKAITGARQALKEKPYDAWQLIGRAACMKGELPLVKEALRRLDPPRQSMVQFACRTSPYHLLSD